MNSFMNKKRVCIKVRLDKIMYSNKDDNFYDELFRAINNSNELIHNCYLFIRSFILFSFKYGNIHDFNIDDLKFDEKFIRLVFSIINTDGSNDKKGGRPFGNSNAKFVEPLKNYFELFSSTVSLKRNKFTKISYILNRSCEQIYISVINNLKYHFEKHVWKYIKCKFIDELETLKKNKKGKELKALKRILTSIKTYILNGSDIGDNMDDKYKKVIVDFRKNVLPLTYTKKKFSSDVEKNTMSYLKCSYIMNKFIQSKSTKSYQFFPIRTSGYQKYININTSALIDIFCKTNKLECFTKAGDNVFQERIWNECFKLKRNGLYLYKHKGFSFNYEIGTDGYGASLNFINNEEIEKKETKKARMRKGREDLNKKRKELSEKDLNDYLSNKELLREQKKEERKQQDKERRAKKKREFKKLSVLEQEKIKSIMNSKREFPYIERLLKNNELRDKFKKKFNEGKLIFCDPGKRSILYLMASNKVQHIKKKALKFSNFGVSYWKGHKFMNYTSKTRSMFTKRGHFSNLIDNWKKKIFDKNGDISVLRKILKGIKKLSKKDKKIISSQLKKKRKSLKDLEIELSELSSKSCSHEKFLSYVRKKLIYNNKLHSHYDTKYIRKLKWHSYLNKNKHENQLLNHIQNEFGEDITIIMGDWSGQGQIKFISTPNVSIKRKLSERFEVYLIDEYMTSKVHHRSNCLGENVKVFNKDKTERKKLHAVLSFKIDNNGSANNNSNQLSSCINRDKNSVLNMERIIKELIEKRKKPSIFNRKRSPSPIIKNLMFVSNNGGTLCDAKSIQIVDLSPLLSSDIKNQDFLYRYK